jgi:outer membrane biosynthesis protein TonB
MPKKYLLTFTDEEAAKVEALAVQHGRTPTGLLTYIARLQIGTVTEALPLRPVQISAQEHRKEPRAEAMPEDTEQPLREAPKRKPEQEQQKEPEQEAPKKDAMKEARQQVAREAEPISKDVSKYTERIGGGIYSNGTHYTLNRFGNRSFFRTLEEAEKALKKT